MQTFKSMLNEAVDTRGAITKALEKMAMGGVKVPQAKYTDRLEYWVLDLETTSGEADHLVQELIKINSDRFSGVNVIFGKQTTKIELPL